MHMYLMFLGDAKSEHLCHDCLYMTKVEEYKDRIHRTRSFCLQCSYFHRRSMYFVCKKCWIVNDEDKGTTEHSRVLSVKKSQIRK